MTTLYETSEMFRLITICLVLSYVDSHAITTLINPAPYELLRFSSAGSFKEYWYFNKNSKFMSIIVPSMVNYRHANEDCSPNNTNNTYQESISVKIRRMDSLEVGSGHYVGIASYNSSIIIPIKDNKGNVLSVEGMVNTLPYYAIEFLLNSEGLYPWRKTRRLSDTCIIAAYSNVEGYAIGLEYSIQ